MSSTRISLRRWIAKGAVIGSLTLALYFLIYFSIVLSPVGFPNSLTGRVTLYSQMALVCLPAGGAVALIVGLIAKRQQRVGKINVFSILASAAGLGILPSLLLLLGSFGDGLTISQAMNILTGFGIPPAAIATGTAAFLIRSIDI